MIQLLLQQAKAELGASAWYLAAAYWAEARGYSWLASKFRNSSNEEKEHSLFFTNLVSGYFAENPDVEQPEPTIVEASDYCDAVKQALDLEIEVTGLLNKLWEAVTPEIRAYLSWMLTGQVYSVCSLRELYMQAEACEDYGLFDALKANPDP